MSKKLTWDDVMIEYIDTFRSLGIFYEEPSGTEPLLNGKDGDVCYSLRGETPETFRDRIERSKKAGRNLFYEELPEDKIEYDPDVQY